MTACCRRPGAAVLDARGASLIDTLVAVVLLSILMAAAYGSLTTQLRAHARETMTAETLNSARTAARVMADQIEMAGFGVPIATKPAPVNALIATEAHRLSFWSNVRATHTFLATTALKNATSVSVVSAGDVHESNSVYITDATNWHLGRVDDVEGKSIRLDGGLSYNFVAGSLLVPVERVTFELVGDELRRNGKRLVSGVTELSFAYDAANLGDIRRITVSLSLQTRAGDPGSGERRPFALTMHITPHNLML